MVLPQRPSTAFRSSEHCGPGVHRREVGWRGLHAIHSSSGGISSLSTLEKRTGATWDLQQAVWFSARGEMLASAGDWGILNLRCSSGEFVVRESLC
jgi:hypothetical protein